MIINNNTKDVAYLGSASTDPFLKHLLKSKKESVFNKPIWVDRYEGNILLFDCNGCRYGFRIKQLKTK